MWFDKIHVKKEKIWVQFGFALKNDPRGPSKLFENS